MGEERVILGLSEKVILIGNNSKTKEVVVRIDTGATTSSVDEHLANELELGPVVRKKTIKSASGIESRDIVEAEVDIAGKRIKAEFSIANRGNLTYQALLGQNVLIVGKFMVDPLKKNSDEKPGELK
tara:strand:+ start:181 stop:561 length:381 start_codon:yes stop_codon:yes gene_type:complete